MGKPDITKFIKYDELTEAQRLDLAKRFEERKKQLQGAINLLNKGLAQLKKKKPKR